MDSTLPFGIILTLCCTSAWASEFALSFDPLLDQAGFASPTVEIIVNGKKGIFLVDTGASLSVVASWFAAESNIVQNTMAATTGANDQAPLAKIDLALKSSNGETLVYKNKEVWITSLPSSFRVYGISGILSPQSLITKSGAATLNLGKVPSLIISDISHASLKDYTPLTSIHSISPEVTHTILYVVDGKIANLPVRFLVDSGADNAAIGNQSRAGKKLLHKSITSHEKVGGISGKPSSVRLLTQIETTLLGRKFKMDVRLQPTSQDMPAEGMLGMKFLRGCSIILENVQGFLHCP